MLTFQFLLLLLWLFLLYLKAIFVCHRRNSYRSGKTLRLSKWWQNMHFFGWTKQSSMWARAFGVFWEKWEWMDFSLLKFHSRVKFRKNSEKPSFFSLFVDCEPRWNECSPKQQAFWMFSRTWMQATFGNIAWLMATWAIVLPLQDR